MTSGNGHLWSQLATPWIAHYSLRLVFGTNKTREYLVKAIEDSHNFTAADIEFLKKTLKEDSNLVFKLDCAAVRQFVRGEMHDDEVARLQARTATTMEDTKMTNLVEQYIRELQRAGQGARVIRDRWQNENRTAFPRIYQGQPAVPPAPTIAAPPARNPWGARVPAVNRLFGTNSTPSLQRDAMGGSSTAMDPPKAFSSKLASLPNNSPTPRPITMEFPPPERPELPQSGLPSPTKIVLPQSNDTIAEETATETSGYLDSNESIFPRTNDTNSNHPSVAGRATITTYPNSSNDTRRMSHLHQRHLHRRTRRNPRLRFNPPSRFQPLLRPLR